MSTVICGIDPGLNGAFAFIDLEQGSLSITDMPTLERGGKRHTDPSRVGAILFASKPKHITIEHVHSSTQMGVASSFSFGRSFGILLGVAHASGAQVSEVTPAVWKPAMGCSADKRQTVARASALMPGCASAWRLVKHTDRAEAALLALYSAVRLGLEVPNLKLVTA